MDQVTRHVFTERERERPERSEGENKNEEVEFSPRFQYGRRVSCGCGSPAPTGFYRDSTVTVFV